MKIDWFTFGAQIVNFLVLVALLRWLLYGPIVRAMKRREATTAERLEQADRKRKEAEQTAEQYERKTRELDDRRAAMLQEAHREAEEERQRLIKEAHQEVGHKRDQWREAFERERHDILFELRAQIGRIATQAARRVLSQLADTALEERIVGRFVSRLQGLGTGEREKVVRHLGGDNGEVLVRSTFDLPDEWRQRLQEAVHEHFGSDAEISFEKSNELICGLELNVGGYCFGWNVRELLQEMEEGFQDRMKTT